MKKLLPFAVLTLFVFVAFAVAACDGGATTTTAAPVQTSTATATGSPWTLLTPTGTPPVARAGQCVVYDSKADRLILFGGTDSKTLFNDTWAYSVKDNAWTELKPGGDLPEGRVAMTMVYDPIAGKAIMFGGMTNSQLLGDTWTYDPEADLWEKVETVGDTPSARGGHAMVYDSAAGNVVLFAGKDDSGVLNDTWTFDLASSRWTRVEPASASPTARYGHAMAVDEATGTIILFGGWDTAKYFNSTWVFDPEAGSWTSLDTQGGLPKSRAGHTLIYDSAKRNLVLFGGTSGTSFLRDTIYFDPATATWDGTPMVEPWPLARNGHSLVYDPATGTVLLFGGWDGKNYGNDIWSLAG